MKIKISFIIIWILLRPTNWKDSVSHGPQNHISGSCCIYSYLIRIFWFHSWRQVVNRPGKFSSVTQVQMSTFLGCFPWTWSSVSTNKGSKDFQTDQSPVMWNHKSFNVPRQLPTVLVHSNAMVSLPVQVHITMYKWAWHVYLQEVWHVTGDEDELSQRSLNQWKLGECSKLTNQRYMETWKHAYLLRSTPRHKMQIINCICIWSNCQIQKKYVEIV